MKKWFLLVVLAVFLTASVASLAIAQDGEYGNPQNGEITDISPANCGGDQVAPATGVDGRNGYDGRDGQNGRNGKSGRNGHNGHNGRNGRDAIAGHKAVEREIKSWHPASRSYVDAKVAAAKSKNWHGFVDGRPIVIGNGGTANFNYDQKKMTVVNPPAIVRRNFKLDNNGLYALFGTLGIIALCFLAPHITREARRYNDQRNLTAIAATEAEARLAATNNFATLIGHLNGITPGTVSRGSISGNATAEGGNINATWEKDDDTNVVVNNPA